MTVLLRLGLAMSLAWGTAAGQDTGSVPPRPMGPARISGGVMAGAILTKVNPVYPADAKAQGIEGAVVLHAIIGRDGTVQNLLVTSGNELLAQAAVDAVKQWTYRPYLLNGVATEVDTTVTVNFRLGPGPSAPVEPSLPTMPSGTSQLPPPPLVLHGDAPVTTPVVKDTSHCVVPASTAMATPGSAPIVPASFMSSRILNHPSPLYPKGAKMKRISGVVMVYALIGKDGTIQDVRPMCGPPELVAASLDAVRKWTYRPYYDVDGKPLAVETTVTVTFSMEAKTAPPTGTGAWTNGIEVVDLRTDSPELNGTKRTPPKYPKEAKRAGVSGEVAVLVLVGAKGKVSAAKALTGPDLLREAAEKAVWRYKYPPYSIAGVPKLVRTTEVVRFNP